MGYLDYAGLQYLWGKLKEKFAPKSHSHDDRYYTESEMDGKLNSKVNNNEVGANGLINKLSTADDIPNDATVFISQHNDGKTASYYRRPISTLWTYIKSKADSVYQPKGSYAASSHTHDDRYYTESEVNTKLGTKASSDHAHGLNSSSLTKTVDNAATNSWDMVGGNKDFLLRSLRMQAKAPDWLENNYAAGIAFGGSDTKGVISHAYSSPAIKFAGGNGTAPRWWLRLTGTSGKTYDLNAMPPASHTHTKDQVGLSNVDNTADANKSVKYAATAGTADVAKKLSTTAGSATQPVYFENGVPVATTYALNKTVPADAKFTDTNTWRGIQNNLTSDSADQSLSAAQGKVLKGMVDGKLGKNDKATSASSADKAAKLTTARTVSGGSDITLSFNYDGSGNSIANIGFYSCKHLVGNTNNYPFHRFAKLENLTGSYTDKTMLVYITQDYNDGCFGLCRLSLRTNNSSSASTVEAKWLVRSGLSADFVQVAIYNVYGKTYADAFIKINGTYAGTTVRALSSGSRATSGRTWTLVDSNEVNGTTATDKKTSSECWKTIAEAGVAIHKQAYSSSASAIDKGYVASAGSANTAASCIGNSASATKLTSSAGSATQPVYFKDGKPVAGTYTLGDASSKIVRTLGAVGNTGWANKTTDDKYVPTMSFMAYWNGAYSSTSSNLQYCDRGRFGTIVTKNTGDYASAGHTHNSVKDIGNNFSNTTFAYSKDGMNYGDYTWLAGWNGYELRAVNKNQFATAWHTHTKSQITDFPASLKNPTALTIQTNGATAATYDGSAAKTVNITKGNFGLGNVDNTADADKSVKYATSAGSANGVIPEWSGSVDLNSSSWLAAWSSDGKKIKAMPTGTFATAGHTHNSIKDIGNNSSDTTFAYSKAGMNYADYTWLAGWNGYELRAINKNQFATAEQGVTASGSNYVRFGNGTQICWGITNCKGKEVTASFAVAFNNTNYAVTIMGDYASWADTYWITGNHTTTSFAIKASTSSLANRPINWIAIGTWK